MKNPKPEERYSKTFAFLIIVTLIITILMRGTNTRFDVPHILYTGIAIICGIVGMLSYVGFLYYKIFKPAGSQMLPDVIKIISLGVMIYFIVTFSVSVVAEF